MTRTDKVLMGFAALGYLIAAFFWCRPAAAGLREPEIPRVDCEVALWGSVDGKPVVVWECTQHDRTCQVVKIGRDAWSVPERCQEIGVDRNGEPVGT